MQFESLESRRLLSSVTYHNQILTILGSPGRDRIRISILIDPAGSTARVLIDGHGGAVPGFPLFGDPPPKQVVVDSGNGNDTIKLDNLEGLPMILHAGRGDDQIEGLSSATTIFGGGGNDIISAASSGDPGLVIFGGDGNDRIIASSNAHNQLHGGNGDDTLIGAGGDDQLFGDAGNDVLKGGQGIDTYFGGNGNDRIYSADGNANEPVDAGEGNDRAFFPDDCTRPLDDFADTEDVLVLGTHYPYRPLVICSCC